MLPVPLLLDTPTFDGEVCTVAYFDLYICSDWPDEQILLSLGELREPLTPEMSGGWLEDDGHGRGSKLVLNSRWTTGELRPVRCAVEWRGDDDRQTSWLVTLPLRASAYTHALPGSPLVKFAAGSASLPVAPSPAVTAQAATPAGSAGGPAA